MTRRMVVPGYSEHDKQMLATWKRCLEWVEQHPNGRIRLDWTGDEHAKDARRIFHRMIDNAINRRAGVHHSRGRKDCPEYQTALMRDAITIRHHRQHGYFSQFGKPLTREGRRAASGLAV